MQQLRRVEQYSRFLMFFGLGLAATVLFLQPMTLLGFFAAAFSFSSPAKAGAETSSLLFWIALFSFVSGLIGVFLVRLKKHAHETASTALSNAHGNTDQGEENWIFI